MSEKYKVRDFSKLHFITVSIIDLVDLAILKTMFTVELVTILVQELDGYHCK